MDQAKDSEGSEGFEDESNDISDSEEVVMRSHECMRATGGDVPVNDTADTPDVPCRRSAPSLVLVLRRWVSGGDVDQVLTIRKWLWVVDRARCRALSVTLWMVHAPKVERCERATNELVVGR